MAKFIFREKLSKKARKELDNQKRTVWAFSPTTKKVESKKLYNRKKSDRAWKDDFGMSAFCLSWDYSAINPFACSAATSASFAGPVSVPSLSTRYSPMA